MLGESFAEEHAHVNLISSCSDALKLTNGSYYGGVSGKTSKSYKDLDLDQKSVPHSSRPTPCL